MKTLLLSFSLLVLDVLGYSQTVIHDEAIQYQEERMVFKQWDKDKFAPYPNRFLGIPTNALWYYTWALHPDYPDTDRRPLRLGGEQTQRLALAAAMASTSTQYKKQSDTLRNVALTEAYNYSGALSSLDPLYQLYYKKELAPLYDIQGTAFRNVSPRVQAKLSQSGVYTAFVSEMQSLAERYDQARNVDLDRGQRILMYHRLLLEYRKLYENWKYRVDLTEKTLAYQDMWEKKKNSSIDPGKTGEANDDEILKAIMRKRINMTP